MTIAIVVIRKKGYLHDAVLVGEEGFVTVAKVEAPEAHVFVC